MLPKSLPLRLYFDYVDAASYLLEARVRGLIASTTIPALILEPFEIRPPPSPLLDPDDPERERIRAHLVPEARELGLELKRPWIIPWTRKAHELALHGEANGCFHEIHRAIFRAYFGEERDIGRVDVLVEIARQTGLDPMETKAVLDVDRFRDQVEDKRRAALAAGVEDFPALKAGDEILGGYPDTRTLEGFLAPYARRGEP